MIKIPAPVFAAQTLLFVALAFIGFLSGAPWLGFTMWGAGLANFCLWMFWMGAEQ